MSKRVRTETSALKTDSTLCHIEHTLSARGALAKRRPFSYFDAFVESIRNSYDQKLNAEGYINLAVAQDVLTSNAFHDRLLEAFATPDNIPVSSTSYDDMKGSHKLRKAMAAHILKRMATSKRLNFHTPPLNIGPQHIVISSGAGAIIENLAFCIANKGDYVMIPAPFYPAFPNDLRARMGINCVPVCRDFEYGKNMSYEFHKLPSEAAFRRAMGQRRGERCAAIIICNPDNPTGIRYTSDDCKEIVMWATREGIHVIFDEVYACSMLQDERRDAMQMSGVDFLQDLESSDSVRAHVHIVYGLSKDFCASGYRVGALCTMNADILRAMDNISYFCAVPGPLQCALVDVLEDENFMDTFLRMKTKRLSDQWKLLSAELIEPLKKINPKFTDREVVRADAGIFMFLNLSMFFDDKESESEFWYRMYDDAKVVLTPGNDCAMPIEGFFRICYASVSPEILKVACQRIVKACSRTSLDEIN